MLLAKIVFSKKKAFVFVWFLLLLLFFSFAREKHLSIFYRQETPTNNCRRNGGVGGGLAILRWWARPAQDSRCLRKTSGRW